MSDDKNEKKGRRPPLSAFFPGERKFQLSLFWRIYLVMLFVGMGMGTVGYLLSWTKAGRSIAQEATFKFPF